MSEFKKYKKEITFWLACFAVVWLWQEGLVLLLTLPLWPFWFIPAFAKGAPLVIGLAGGWCFYKLLMRLFAHNYVDASSREKFFGKCAAFLCAYFQFFTAASFLLQSAASSMQLQHDRSVAQTGAETAVRISNYRETPIYSFQLPAPTALQVEFDLAQPAGVYNSISLDALLQAANGRKSYLKCAKSGEKWYPYYALDDAPEVHIAFTCHSEELHPLIIQGGERPCISNGAVKTEQGGASTIAGDKLVPADYAGGAKVVYDLRLKPTKSFNKIGYVDITSKLQAALSQSAKLTDVAFWVQSLQQWTPETFGKLHYVSCQPPFLHGYVLKEQSCYCPQSLSGTKTSNPDGM